MLVKTCDKYPGCEVGHCVPPCCYPRCDSPNEQCRYNGVTYLQRRDQALKDLYEYKRSMGQRGRGLR